MGSPWKSPSRNDLVAAQNLGIELERPVHVLHRDAKMLDTLQPPPERPVVAALDPIRTTVFLSFGHRILSPSGRLGPGRDVTGAAPGT
jgi:hypothetical protein